MQFKKQQLEPDMEQQTGSKLGQEYIKAVYCHLAYLFIFGYAGLQDRKRLVFISIPKKSNAKECSNYCTISLISHTSKVMLKILQTRLQQYVNQEIPDVQAGFRYGRGTRDQIANSVGSSKKQRNYRKTSTSASLTMLKPFTVWITTN